MKCDLLSLLPLDQFLYTIKERLIRHAGRHLVVVVRETFVSNPTSSHGL
jgi:hypothetical protein